MKFYSIIIITILATHSLAQDCKATITLSSDIENTEFFVDTVKIGEGKLHTVKIDTGSYIISARESGNLWDPLTFMDTLHVTDCGNYASKFIFSSVLYLKSEPSDAYVFRNDSLIGNTPLHINEFSDLKLKKPGYKDIDLKKDNVLNVVSLEENRVKNGKSFYERNLFKYLIGGLLVLGGTTAYLKLEADDKFDRYQLTGDDAFLKETRRYDLYSGITFAALQINFGVLLYYFLTD
jgi:hypothetical protein